MGFPGFPKPVKDGGKKGFTFADLNDKTLKTFDTLTTAYDLVATLDETTRLLTLSTPAIFPGTSPVRKTVFLDPVTNKVYLFNALGTGLGGNLYEVNQIDNTLTLLSTIVYATFGIGVSKGSCAMLDGELYLLSDENTNKKVNKFNPLTGALIGSVATTISGEIFGFQIDMTSKNKIYIWCLGTNNYLGTITSVKGSATVTLTTLSTTLRMGYVAGNTDGSGNIWAGNQTNLVYKLNSAGAVIYSLSHGGDGAPYGLAYSISSAKAMTIPFFTDPALGRRRMWDSSGNPTLTDASTFGHSVYNGLGYSDGLYLYLVGNYNPGNAGETVRKFDGSGNLVWTSGPTILLYNMWDIALNPITKDIFAANGQYTTTANQNGLLKIQQAVIKGYAVKIGTPAKARLILNASSVTVFRMSESGDYNNFKNWYSGDRIEWKPGLVIHPSDVAILEKYININ